MPDGAPALDVIAMSTGTAFRTGATVFALAIGVAACGGGSLDPATISAPGHCPEIEVDASGDVRLCHHPFGHWTGTELDRDGEPRFMINRGEITAGGHIVARHHGDGIEVIVDDSVPTKTLHIGEDGKAIDGDGHVVAIVRPAPEDERTSLVVAALIREGIWLPALPPKRGRVSATESQTIGRPRDDDEPPPRLCDCTNPPP